MTADEETPNEDVKDVADDVSDASEEPTEITDDTSVEKTPSAALVATRRAAGWCRSNVRPIVLLALVVAAGAVTTGVYLSVYRPDRDFDHAAAERVIAAASEGAVAALSYSSDALDHDIANAKLHLTGDFLEYYTKFTQNVVAPTVREKHLTQQATVVRAAVEQLHPASAVVLTYITETTKGPERKDPLTTPSVVRITLQKVDGAWLISKLDPIG